MRPCNYFDIEHCGHALVVALSRNINSIALTEFSRGQAHLIDELRNSPAKGVIIDFEHCEVLGSPVFTTLCLVWTHVLEHGHTMVLCNLSDTSLEALSESDFGAPWLICPSRKEALEELHRLRLADKADVGADTIHGDLSNALPRRLQILEVGRSTTVSFGDNLPPEYEVGRYVSEIQDSIDRSGCRELALDITGLTTTPRGFLGLLKSVLEKGVHVSLLNPSADICEVMALTNHDRLVTIIQTHARRSACELKELS